MNEKKVHIIFTTTGTVITQGMSFTGPQLIFHENSVETREFYDTEGVFQSILNLERKEFEVIGACQAIIDETEEATFITRR
ncbi:hypothetical protein AV650_14240 [Serratia fonticola]|nr:hypothetical protein AV650_14240 [Serratia fonticola]